MAPEGGFPSPTSAFTVGRRADKVGGGVMGGVKLP